jgi:hypothetical protein
MSEDEARRSGHEEEQEEVEGHRQKLVAANEEAGDEGEDDDIEAHRQKGTV